MKKTDILAYTAGIMDGEGTIRFNKPSTGRPYVRVEVFVTNTNEWLCQWLKMQYGGSVYYMHDDTRKANWKAGYRWWIFGSKAYAFLNLILPYLNLKRPHAEIAISYQNRRKPGGHLTTEERLVDEAERIVMTRLNKKGR